MIIIHKNKIYIRDYNKILSIDENQITILINKNVWEILGNKFMINYLNADEIEISGMIQQVEIKDE